MKEVSILSIIRKIKKDNMNGWNLEYADYNSDLICNLDRLLNKDNEEEGEFYE